MVASQGASEAFTAQFLDDPENWSIIEQAQIFCSEVIFNSIESIYSYSMNLRGFFLFHVVKHLCVFVNMLLKVEKSLL